MRQHFAILFTGIFLSFICYDLFVSSAYVELELSSDVATICKIYWPREDGRYVEHNMARVRVTPAKKHYTMRIAGLENLDHLRIDVAESQAQVIIKRLAIQQTGYEDIILTPSNGLNQLEQGQDIRTMQHLDEGVFVHSIGADPQLKFMIPERGKQPEVLLNLIRILAVFLALYALRATAITLLARHNYVPVLLFAVFIMAVAMAVISDYNQHPDEFVHVMAAEYYQDNWLPPQCDDPAIAHTYSNYGTSRLNSGEIAYLFAGKFLRLLAPLHLETYFALRCFNLFLFVSILLLSLQLPPFRVLLIPFLATPQVWYIFSYFNSDAFALFMLLLLALQAVTPGSAFNRLLHNGISGSQAIYLLPLGLLLALSLQVKMNAYFFHLFLCLYFLWRIIFKEELAWRSLLRRLLIIVLVGLAIGGLLRSVTYLVNGLDRGAKLYAARLQYASDSYNPNTLLEEKSIYHQLHAKGSSLGSMIYHLRWPEKVFRTFFGVYGYTSISASFAYYDHIRVMALCMLALLAAAISLRGGIAGFSLLSITLLTTAALLGIALLRSWHIDFQAQGRYFLCCLVMLGMVLYHYEHLLPRLPFYLLLFTMYLLSSYNFIGVGLYDIVRCPLTHI